MCVNVELEARTIVNVCKKDKIGAEEIEGAEGRKNVTKTSIVFNECTI